MKAAVLREFKKPLAIEEIGQPQAGPGEILIRIEACGVCHSDVHVADGDWPQFAKIVKTPLILGHEVAGVVTEKDAAVEDLKIGDRVGIPWIYWTCGECEFCREGTKTFAAGKRSPASPSMADMPNSSSAGEPRRQDSRQSFFHSSCSSFLCRRYRPPCPQTLRHFARATPRSLRYWRSGTPGRPVWAGAPRGGSGDRHLRRKAGACPIVGRLFDDRCFYEQCDQGTAQSRRRSRLAGDVGCAGLL